PHRRQDRPRDRRWMRAGDGGRVDGIVAGGRERTRRRGADDSRPAAAVVREPRRRRRHAAHVRRSRVMCLAMPGQIVALAEGGHLATVEVSKVRRTINIDLVEPRPEPGEWVLIHVGFAMSRISGDEAAEQLRLLAMLGEDAEAMA